MKLYNIVVGMLLIITLPTIALHSTLARDQIRIVGSSTVFPFAAAVAEQYAKKTGAKAPVVESTGTGGGFKLFCSGIGVNYPDITGASRTIKESELTDCESKGITPLQVPIGYDGIVVASSKDGQAFNLTLEELWRALAKTTGTPENGLVNPNPYKYWDDIRNNLPHIKIEVLGPPPTSGTRDAFVELVMDKGCKNWVEELDDETKKKVCQTIREDGAFIEAGENDNLIVQKLQTNPEALGIFGYSFLDMNRDTLQDHSIEGIEATYGTIANGSYPISRILYVYVKAQHVELIPGIVEYMSEFIRAAEDDESYLADKGLIPLKN